MALIKCKECGAMVSEHASECPYCGYPLATPVSTEKRVSPHTGLYIVIACLVVGLLAVAGWMLFGNSGGSNAAVDGVAVADSAAAVQDTVLTPEQLEVRRQKEELAQQREAENAEIEEEAKEEHARYLEHERLMREQEAQNAQAQQSAVSAEEHQLRMRYIELDKQCRNLLGQLVAMNRAGTSNPISYGQIKFRILDNLSEMKRIGSKIGYYDDAVKIDRDMRDAFRRFEERGYR